MSIVDIEEQRIMIPASSYLLCFSYSRDCQIISQIQCLVLPYSQRMGKLQITNLKGILDYSEKQICKRGSHSLAKYWRHKKGNVEKILKVSLDSNPSTSPSVKVQIMGRKVCLNVNAKHCTQKVCWHHQPMFCLITLTKLSSQ